MFCQKVCWAAPGLCLWSGLSPCWDQIWHSVTLWLNEVITLEAITTLSREQHLSHAASCFTFVCFTSLNKHKTSSFLLHRHNQDNTGNWGPLSQRWTNSSRLYHAVKVSHCPFTPSTVNQYVVLIKSLHESTASDINQLRHSKLHHLMTIPYFSTTLNWQILWDMKQHVEEI